MVKNPTEIRQFQIMLVVTHACNLSCVYCYEKKRDSVIVDVNRFKEIIATYLNSDDYDYIVIEFFGGEPWIKKDVIREICEWTWRQHWKNNYRFFTSTNGTLIHGEIQKWLHNHNRQISCGLSLDGTPNTHNQNRCNSFAQIDINFFLSNWPNQPVKMTITPQSLSNLSENIIYLHDLGFKLAGTNFAEGINWSKTEYCKTLQNELEKLVNYYLEHPDIEVAPLLDLSIENCEFDRQYVRNKDCAGKTIMAYDCDGKEYPCNYFTPMSFSNEQLNSIHISDFLDDKNLIDEYCFHNCYFYPICPNCYGANYLANGKLSERDKSMCNLVKIRAYYCAALIAQRICQKNACDDQEIVSLKIKAIQRIKRICEGEKF
ncbi:MAG: radical SAM protein [Bacteroidales bacterium]|nr:radical SAM protein [Bacteroidales bacterium]